MSCDSSVAILLPLFLTSLKLENGLKRRVPTVTKIKYGFVRLVVISFIFTRFDYVIPSPILEKLLFGKRGYLKIYLG